MIFRDILINEHLENEEVGWGCFQHTSLGREKRKKNVRKTSPISMKTRENFTALGGHEVKNSDVVKTIINHPPVITMFIGDMVAIPWISGW